MADTVVTVGLDQSDDYSTIADALAGYPNKDLVALGVNLRIKVRSDQIYTSMKVVSSDVWVTSPENMLIIEAMDGHECNGKSDGVTLSRSARWETAAFSLEVGHFELRGLTLRNADVSGSSAFAALSANLGGRVVACRLSGYNGANAGGNDGKVDFIGCLYVDCISDSIDVGSSFGKDCLMRQINCTSVDSGGSGFTSIHDGAVGYSFTEKCLSVGSGVIDYESGNDHSLYSNNASGDASADAFINVNPYDVFVDYDNRDFTIKADSALGLAGVGAFIQQVEASDFNINASFLSPAPVLSASLSNDAPSFGISAEFTSPSVQMSSSLSAANPEFNLSSGFVATSPALSVSISSDAPEINLSASFSAPMPMLSASLAGDVPEFNLSASFVVPHVTSSVYLSAELPEFDISASMTTPSIELLSSITTSVDDVDLSAAFTVPSAVLGAVLINGDIIKITPTENIINSKPRSRMLFTKDRGRYL